MFRSLSHFEFIFVHGMRVYSSFIVLHAAVYVYRLPQEDQNASFSVFFYIAFVFFIFLLE